MASTKYLVIAINLIIADVFCFLVDRSHLTQMKCQLNRMYFNSNEFQK